MQLNNFKKIFPYVPRESNKLDSNIHISFKGHIFIWFIIVKLTVFLQPPLLSRIYIYYQNISIGTVNKSKSKNRYCTCYLYKLSICVWIILENTFKSNMVF